MVQVLHLTLESSPSRLPWVSEAKNISLPQLVVVKVLTLVRLSEEIQVWLTFYLNRTINLNSSQLNHTLLMTPLLLVTPRWRSVRTRSNREPSTTIASSTSSVQPIINYYRWCMPERLSLIVNSSSSVRPHIIVKLFIRCRIWEASSVVNSSIKLYLFHLNQSIWFRTSTLMGHRSHLTTVSSPMRQRSIFIRLINII